MQIQLNTDRNIEGTEELAQQVRDAVESILGRFAEQLTRVEVHLSDENGPRTRGNDKKCVMEARPAGMQPVAVTEMAATVDQAVDGAAEKLERLLESTFGRLHNPRGRTPHGGEQNV